MPKHFQRSDEIMPLARRVLRQERERLRALVPGGQLVLTGGSSVSGTLTSGDIDLHLRVPPDAFVSTIDALREVYAVVHPEIWCSTLATFRVPIDQRVGVAVTPVGSEHDRFFTDAWERLRADAEALAAYTEMKRSCSAVDEPAYLAAKAAFFNQLVAGATEPPKDEQMTTERDERP